MVVLAAIIGGAAQARAHTGHAHTVDFHAQPVSAAGAVAINAMVQQSVRVVRNSEDVSPAAGAPMMVEQTRSDAVAFARDPVSGACVPGACCCHGISSCGVAGHCCAVALLHGLRTDPPHTGVLRLPTPHQAFHVPDVVFGLDRPPKA